MSWCIVYFRWLKVILIYCIVLYQNILWHTTLSGIIDKKEIYEIKAISKESSFEQTDKKNYFNKFSSSSSFCNTY